MNQQDQKKTSKGKPAGLNDLQLPPPNIWTNHTESIMLIACLSQNGRHFSYHAAGKKGKAKTQVETPGTSKEIPKKPTNLGNQVAARIADELFFHKPCSPNQIIYFFRFQTDPIKSQQELTQFIEEKFQTEIKWNNHLKHLESKYVFQRELSYPNYNKLFQDKFQQKSEQCTIEKDVQQNLFALELFIDPQLAIILNKMYFLLDPNFIYELILVCFAQLHSLDVFDVLTFGKAEPKDFPQIIQNIYIQEVIKFTNHTNSNYYQILSIQGLKEDFKLFIKNEACQKIINQRINELVNSFKNQQYVEEAQYENAQRGSPIIASD